MWTYSNMTSIKENLKTWTWSCMLSYIALVRNVVTEANKYGPYIACITLVKYLPKFSV